MDQERAPNGLVTIVEAARLLAVSRSTVYRLMKSGAIASVRIRGSRRIPASALRRYLEPSAGARS